MSNFSNDGPNYQAVFTGMKCLHGGNSEDVKIIVRFLRFYQGTEEYELYLKHYLPMLSPEVAAEFKPKEEKKVTTIKVELGTPTVANTTADVSISTPKKRRSSK